MATDSPVTITLRAELKQYEAALKTAVRQTERAAKAAEEAMGGVGKNARPDFRGMNDNFRKSARQLENDARATQSRIQRIFASMGTAPRIGGAAVGGFLGGIAAGFSLQEAQQLIDASQRINNALKSTGLSGAELTKVYNELFATAQKNAAPIEDLVNLYSRLSLSQKELKVSQGELIHFTGTIAAALRAGGQSAEQASGALTQLSQALGGGVVRAEEFNSVLEGAPTIIQAAAAGIAEAGGSVGKLRQLMIDGKVSSEAFFKGIEAGAPVIEQRLAGAELTISQAFVRLQNVLIDTATRIDDATGASKILANFLNGTLTQAIKDIGNLFTMVGNGPIGSFVGWVNKAVDAVVQASSDIGAAAGINIGGQPFLSQSRLDQLERIQKLQQTKEGGRKPTVVDATQPATVVKPISIKDYPIESGKIDKAAERAAKQASDKIQKSITDSIGVAVDAAEQLLGANENRNAGQINTFLKKGGVDLNAATTAWCAAFVNSALAQVGIKGTGSNVATDFAKWGVNVQPKDVVRGDVLVETHGRAAGQTGGHVGFATGQMRETADGIKQLEMISGNASDKVAKDWVNVSSVIARRASESAGFTADQLRHVTEVQRVSAESTIEALDRETQTLQQQGAVYGAAAQTIDQATIAKQALAETIKIENDLLAQNIELTAAQRDQLLASVTANLTAQERLTQAQQASSKSADDLKQTMSDLGQTLGQMAVQGIVGFVQDLRNGVSAAEALYNAVSRIADQLLSMALNMAIQQLFKSIAGGIGGGMMAPGLFASGGYTGDRSMRAPAGIVHGQEFVINAQATKKHRALLENINRGVPGYASGGFVLPRIQGPGMAQNASASPPQVNTRTTVVNTFDAGSFLSEALSRPDGVNVILNAVRAQPGAFRQAMQS